MYVIASEAKQSCLMRKQNNNLEIGSSHTLLAKDNRKKVFQQPVKSDPAI